MFNFKSLGLSLALAGMIFGSQPAYSGAPGEYFEMFIVGEFTDATYKDLGTGNSVVFDAPRVGTGNNYFVFKYEGRTGDDASAFDASNPTAYTDYVGSNAEITGNANVVLSNGLIADALPEEFTLNSGSLEVERFIQNENGEVLHNVNVEGNSGYRDVLVEFSLDLSTTENGPGHFVDGENLGDNLLTLAEAQKVGLTNPSHLRQTNFNLNFFEGENTDYIVDGVTYDRVELNGRVLNVVVVRENDSIADLNNDGVLDQQDIILFVTAFPGAAP